jgi:hypothetical protein
MYILALIEQSWDSHNLESNPYFQQTHFVLQGVYDDSIIYVLIQDFEASI